MTLLTRRDFAKSSLAAGVAAAAPGVGGPAIAQGVARIVIVGGGAGGATVANRIKSSHPQFDITLIEPKSDYVTCFYSNLYIGGFRSLASLTHGYDGLKARGIKVVTDRARAVDTTAKTVELEASGSTVSYDRLVIAPGIDFKFNAIEGYTAEAALVMPHAWQGGPQTSLLKEKLLAMPNGGTVVMSIPDNPYRCPPGPYERACMIGHFLKTKKPKSKLIVFDAKKTFSKQAVFQEAFAEYYKDVVELNLTNEIDDYRVVRVDPATGDVVTKAGRTERAAVANIIPPQRAGAIAEVAGCTDGDWCPVNLANFTSSTVKDVYVLGDAAKAADMPKSAYSASSQANVVAADIVADLTGVARTEGEYRNICWSLLAPNNSVKIGADYKPGLKDGMAMLQASNPFVSAPGEDSETRAQTYEESVGWYDTLAGDIFAKFAVQQPATP